MNQHSREYFKCSTRLGEVERVVRRAGEMMLFILLLLERYLKFDNLTT